MPNPIADALEVCESKRRELLAGIPTPASARELTLCDLDRARLVFQIPGKEPEFVSALCEAAAAGAAAVLSRSRNLGTVELKLPDGSILRLPTGAPPLGPQAWLGAMSCALVARDADSGEILADAAGVRAAQVSEREADSFWIYLCAALGFLTGDFPDSARKWLSDVKSRLIGSHIRHSPPAYIRLCISPLVEVMWALAGKKDDVDAPLRAAFDAHREFAASTASAADSVSLELMAMAAVAYDFDRIDEAHGVNLDLLHNKFARTLGVVTFEYAPRRAELPADPIGFLDLEGFPRSGRGHSVVQRDSLVLGRYQATGAPGLPHARIDFILSGSQDAPPALDPGERALLADLCAKEAGELLRARKTGPARARLTQAVEELNAILTIPGGAVPQTAFQNLRGQSEFQREPGRFSRDRLTAYRDSLATQRDKLTPAVAVEPRDAALLDASILADALRPLLTSLRHDRSGQVRSSLRPRPGDYAQVFQPDSLERARQVYERLWMSGIDFDFPSSAQSEIVVSVAPAGMLSHLNELSHPFPGGYMGIAHHLLPHRIWACWKYVKPGESSGLAYDGLVWIDDHWSWFPKPYRALQ